MLTVAGATDGLRLPLREEHGEVDLSGAEGLFSEAAFFFGVGEDRGCFDETLSFWSENFG